jgi:hypothetical protein
MSQTSSRKVWTLRAVGFFGARLPVRMKRLFHLASLGAYLKGSTSLDDDTLNKLNTVMALGSNSAALKLPVLLSRTIWDGKVQHHAQDPDASPSVITPKWLSYGEEGLIQRDVEKLVSVFRQHQEATSAA